MMKYNNDSNITFFDDSGITSFDDTEQKVIPEPYTIFSKSQIIQYLTIASLTSMISPLTASIYLPAINQIESVSFCLIKMNPSY